MIVAAPALLPDGAVRDVAIDVGDDGVIAAVRERRADDPPAVDGIVVPGLVNAHVHTELSWVGDPVPGGAGLAPWVMRSMLRGRDAPAPEARRAAVAEAALHMVAWGTAAVSDVGSDADAAPVLAAAGLQGVLQREFLTMDAGLLPARMREAQACRGEARAASGRVVVRPAAHALYSTAPPLVLACLRGDDGRGPPGSLHVAEDREELRFLRDGTGAFAELLDRLGRDWRWWSPPGVTPVQVLAELGLLGPGLLAVHGVHLLPHDRALLARSRTPLCLCPRSNLHIGGELPDVAALIAAGVRLCLGTDSLASAPDLDLLGDVAVLAEAYPDVDVAVWFGLATAGGADALRLEHLGRIAPGKAPGLVLLEGAATLADAVRDRAPRRWLVRPGVA